MLRFSLLLFISCLLITNIPAQNPPKDSVISSADSMKQLLAAQMAYQDSVDRARSMESMSRNLDSFMKEQKARESREWKRAVLRLCIGIFFLIVFIWGMLRKRKKKQG
ncbi:MAG: hypothetical protein JNL59_09860 [Chitinophagaceae bacterium]|jgi:cytochrome c1|nr:hypothetical protein [Chitinophagaceae bacterium]